jgi:uncharacterized protein YndB with AHSA1/START domain
MKRSMALIVVIALFGVWATRELFSMELSQNEQESLAKGEVIVYLKTVRGPLKEGTAIGLIDAPPEIVFGVVTDNEKFEEFMPYVTQSDMERWEDGEIINYQHLDFPFPVGDRFYKINITNTIEDTNKGKIFKSTWTYVKGSGNIEDTYGSWILEEYGQGRTLIAYIVCTDPGGWIPTWAKNTATEVSLPEVIERVRLRVKNSKNEDQ